jgi:hypothetical protein
MVRLGFGAMPGIESRLKMAASPCSEHVSVAVASRMAAVGVNPGTDVGGVEAKEVAPLDVGDALFVDEAADVADLDAEGVGDLGNVQQPRWRLGVGLWCGRHLLLSLGRRLV